MESGMKPANKDKRNIPRFSVSTIVMWATDQLQISLLTTSLLPLLSWPSICDLSLLKETWQNWKKIFPTPWNLLTLCITVTFAKVLTLVNYWRDGLHLLSMQRKTHLPLWRRESLFFIRPLSTCLRKLSCPASSSACSMCYCFCFFSELWKWFTVTDN